MGSRTEKATNRCYYITTFHGVRFSKRDHAQACCCGDTVTTGKRCYNMGNGIMGGMASGASMAGIVQQHVSPRVTRVWNMARLEKAGMWYRETK